MKVPKIQIENLNPKTKILLVLFLMVVALTAFAIIGGYGNPVDISKGSSAEEFPPRIVLPREPKTKSTKPLESPDL